ncbi:MAG: diacylglycerol kinase family protein [Chitinophagaceae bacterium]
MKSNSFSLKARSKSFRYAFNGIYKFLVQEPNALIHLSATIIVFLAALYFDISKTEAMALVIVTGLVWAAEIFNTAIERIMDFISPDYHPAVEVIKDMAAGAVLITAITAIVTGAIIFIPKMF